MVRRSVVVTLAIALLLTIAPVAQRSAPPVFPGAEWARASDPKSAGYCADKLDLVTAKAKTIATTSATAVVGGRVIWDYGDQTFVSYLASVRKSILAMMYGKYVANGRIKLDKTLEALKIDDVNGLLPQEKQATIGDLLGARSGVYHSAANAASAAGGDTVGEPPARGSVKPGTYFLYNNWDFNALGTIFEQETGQNIYEAFERDIAKPIGLQDFTRAAQRKSENARRSMHPAYHFYLSSRDMARVGYLMLRDGNWNGTQVVPRDWARRIRSVVTPLNELHPESYTKGPFGYGYLWWIWDGPFKTGAYDGGYTGIGAIGQFLTVLPAADMVVAHKTAPGASSVSRADYLALVDLLIGAKCAG